MLELTSWWVSSLPLFVKNYKTEKVTCHLVLSLAHKHSNLQLENAHLPPSTTLNIPNPLLTCLPVSSDTIIAIAFGVLGTAINILSTLLAYLTLRAMIIENRACQHSFYSPLSSLRYEVSGLTHYRRATSSTIPPPWTHAYLQPQRRRGQYRSSS
jgi:hypothetical protein